MFCQEGQLSVRTQNWLLQSNIQAQLWHRVTHFTHHCIFAVGNVEATKATTASTKFLCFNFKPINLLVVPRYTLRCGSHCLLFYQTLVQARQQRRFLMPWMHNELWLSLYIVFLLLFFQSSYGSLIISLSLGALRQLIGNELKRNAFSEIMLPNPSETDLNFSYLNASHANMTPTRNAIRLGDF